ncbi:MAG: heme ABC transporter ATP-binding protein [Pseudomonadota bacterium]
MLKAENISVYYGRKAAVSDVSVAVEAGTLSCIVGPNGSGKTSLLKALTRDVAYAGRVRLNGTDVAQLKAHELAVLRGVLPQASTLAFPFTVLEVVRIGAGQSLYGADTDLPYQALKRVGLEGYGERLFQELSGGEQQRVQLARVLVQIWEPVVEGVPRWLFLDEPVSSLDIAHQLGVMQVARDFADAGGGVIAVMHDLNLTALYADQVMVMAEGEALALGPTRDVLVDGVLSQAYGCQLKVNKAPPPGAPFLLPHTASLMG